MSYRSDNPFAELVGSIIALLIVVGIWSLYESSIPLSDGVVKEKYVVPTYCDGYILNRYKIVDKSGRYDYVDSSTFDKIDVGTSFNGQWR